MKSGKLELRKMAPMRRPWDEVVGKMMIPAPGRRSDPPQEAIAICEGDGIFNMYVNRTAHAYIPFGSRSMTLRGYGSSRHSHDDPGCSGVDQA
jgi:hypothetical protein